MLFKMQKLKTNVYKKIKLLRKAQSLGGGERSRSRLPTRVLCFSLRHERCELTHHPPRTTETVPFSTVKLYGQNSPNREKDTWPHRGEEGFTAKKAE